MSDTVLSTLGEGMGLPEPAPMEEVTLGPGPFWGTGRRKTAIARVRLLRGEPKIAINGRELDAYFHEPQEQAAVTDPLTMTNSIGQFQVFVTVHGGGHAGQAGAVRLGLARALAEADPRLEQKLRDAGFMTRDSRIVERKKYGRRKARRRFQFSKR